MQRASNLSNILVECIGSFFYLISLPGPRDVPEYLILKGGGLGDGATKNLFESARAKGKLLNGSFLGRLAQCLADLFTAVFEDYTIPNFLKITQYQTRVKRPLTAGP